MSFEVPGVAPRMPERVYSAPREQRAIAAARRALLAWLGSDGFRVRHRYRSLNALAGSINAQGLLRLLAHRERVVVELEEGGAGQLAEAGSELCPGARALRDASARKPRVEGQIPR